MGFHTLRNVLARFLQPEDCQRPWKCRLGHLVRFLTLHNASVIFSENIGWQGRDFRVRRQLVGISALHNVSQGILLKAHCAMGGTCVLDIEEARGTLGNQDDCG